MLYRQKGSAYWWTQVHVAGKRYRESTKQTGKTKAGQYEAALIHQLSTGVRSGIRSKAPVLRDYAKHFLSRIESSRLEPKTKEYYRGGWKMIEGLGIAGMRMDGITSGVAASLSFSGSPSHTNNALRTLRRMLSMAFEEEVLLRAPRIKLAKEQGRERLITADEERLILSRAQPTLRDAFILVFDAGMRPCEVAELHWERVDLVRGVILVAGETTKTRSGRRHLPMTQRVREMLMERAKLSSDWVFPSKRYPGKPMSRGAISTMFAAFKRTLGLPRDLVLYSARHTFATDLVGATGNLSQTQRTLGHASISTTTRYLHPSVAALGTIMDERNALREFSHIPSHSDSTIQ